jgi:hypothetical protein
MYGELIEIVWMFQAELGLGLSASLPGSEISTSTKASLWHNPYTPFQYYTYSTCGRGRPSAFVRL